MDPNEDNDDFNMEINDKLSQSITFILNGVEENYKSIYDISLVEIDLIKYSELSDKKIKYMIRNEKIGEKRM